MTILINFHLVKSSSILSGWVPGIGFWWLWRTARTGGWDSQRAESGGRIFGLFAISSGAQIFSWGIWLQNAKSVSVVLTMFKLLWDCWHIICLLFPPFSFVSYYTLSTHNFTSPSNVTFHHSRLMGVSDIENAVSDNITYIPRQTNFFFFLNWKLVKL